MTITPTTISDAYDAIGYWDDSGSVRIAGSADGGTVDMSYFGTDTVDRGATDNILMPACRVINHNLTLQGRLAISGTGGSNILADLSGSGKFDTKGYGTLPSELRPSSGDLHNTVLRASALIDGIQFIDSGTPAGNMLVWQIISTDQPSVLLLNNVSAIGAAGDCISLKASTSLLGTNAEGSLVITNGCAASDPGTASNNQAFTSHDAIRVFGWGNTYTGNSGNGDVAISSVNDGTFHYESNLTATGKVGGLTQLYGATIDHNGLSAAFQFNEDYVTHVQMADVTLSNAKNTVNADDFVRFNMTDASHEVTMDRFLIDDSTGGKTCFRTNSSSRGTVNINDWASVHGSSNLSRVMTNNSNAILAVNVDGCALRGSQYSFPAEDSNTYAITNNILATDGSGYTVPTPSNTVGTSPTAGEVTATGAGNKTYPSPTSPVASFRSGNPARLITLTDPDQIRAVLSSPSGALPHAIQSALRSAIQPVL
jgi:hypothetical protein